MKTISFVIPVYRNEGSITTTFQRLNHLFQGPLATHASEFIFVDDGSDDHSLTELLLLKKTHPHIVIISLSRNFGQTAAVIAGFQHATGDAIINLSADGQEPPEAAETFVKEWEKGAQVVIGQRVSREDSFLANVLGNAYWSFLKWANPNLPKGSDFFLLDRSVATIFNQIHESDRFYPADVAWLGFNPIIVPYHRLKRAHGRSQWSLFKKMKAAIDGILHSTYLPIRFISLMGMLIACTGFLAAVLIIVDHFSRTSIYPGWASIVCLLLFLNGSLMFMLGIIGEYVWRIYHQAKGRPIFLIKKKY